MNLHNKNAQIFIPDDIEMEAALGRTTRLAIGAHQDDLEIMAAAAILDCFHNPVEWFCGVVVTDGAGSPRDGIYARTTDQDMMIVRVREQKKAALLGEYAAQVFLDYPSSAVKDRTNIHTVDDIRQILLHTRPSVVYTHNLADKHETHVAVALRTVAAIRGLAARERPERLLGCEVWRSLDWMLDEEKVVLDLSKQENLQAALLGVFDSQISGGKRYDLATMARRRANATYHTSHQTDTATGINFAMDLTPLVKDPTLNPAEYVAGFMDRLAKKVRETICSLE